MKKFLKASIVLGATLASLTTFTPLATVAFAQSERALELALPSEPPTADPAIATDSSSGTILRNVFEGLTRLNDNKPEPGMAESWEVSADGTVYTFKLRDAKWSNGEPVKASDFEYAWKRVLNPETASEYSFILYYIKGAEAYNTGKGKVEDVGVKALDDKTLEVTLNSPTAFFLELTSFYTYMPVHQATVEKNQEWAADAGEEYVTNGPFVLAEWNHDSDYKLAKNENYWDAANVTLEEANVRMIESEATANAEFQAGSLDFLGSPYQIPSLDNMEKYRADGSLQVTPKNGVYWYKVNTQDEVTGNVNIRKALALAIDRKSLIENITKAEQLPALGVIPPTIAGFESDRGYFADADYEKAKEYLAKGLEELGLKDPSELKLKLSINTSESHSAIAQFIQEGWAKNLGISTEIDNSEWQVYLEKVTAMDYQIARLGWTGDYNDANTFLEMYATADSGNNDTGWENPEYKSLLEQAQAELDPAKRLELLQQAEAILVEEMPVIPIYFYTNAFVVQENVKNIKPDAAGNVDLKSVVIE
ncbi:MAG: peptide ABC transporter substrate-binding protein [Aerococcaceae bacterium]|nr:peptide ABC transporter substrate-binding protein [Aerococcaceae bacterium]